MYVCFNWLSSNFIDSSKVEPSLWKSGQHLCSGPIARPVMVEFLRPDMFESGGCWSRWWTSLPDSDSSPCSSIPVIYRAGFVLLCTRIFFFLAARIAAIHRICPVRPEFQFRSSIAYSLCATRELRAWKKKQIFFSALCVIFPFILDFCVRAIVILDAQATSRHIARLTAIYFARFFCPRLQYC